VIVVPFNYTGKEVVRGLSTNRTREVAVS